MGAGVNKPRERTTHLTTPSFKPTTPSAADRGLWTIAGLVLGAALVIGVLIALLPPAGRAAADHFMFHEPAIRRFASDWPHVDLRGYLSATSPGFHLLLAPVAAVTHATPEHGAVLRLAGSVFTLGLLALLGLVVLKEHRGAGARRAGTMAALLTACLFCSVYVLFAGAWLLPDNAGWLGVVAMLGLAIDRIDRAERGALTRGSVARWLLLVGAAFLFVVATRQSNIWTAGVVLVAAWLTPTDDRTHAGIGKPIDGSLQNMCSRLGARVASSLSVALALAPGLALLAYFASVWGGLVPTRFQRQHQGANLATPAFMLTVAACLSVFFVGFWAPSLARLWRDRRALLLLAGAVGLLLGAVPVTTYLYPARASGLWGLVRVLGERGGDIAGHTSGFILLGSVAGAICVCAWGAMLPASRRWLLGAALLAFVCAQTANTNAWQRYIEPGLLILAALACAWSGRAGRGFEPVGLPTDRRRAGRWSIDGLAPPLRVLGPVALCGLSLAGAWLSVRGSEPIDPRHPPGLPADVYTGPLPEKGGLPQSLRDVPRTAPQQ